MRLIEQKTKHGTKHKDIISQLNEVKQVLKGHRHKKTRTALYFTAELL